MHQAEAAVLALLLSHRKEAVSFGLRRGYSIPRIGHQIEKQVATGITQSRILSRTAGISRVTEELEPLGIDLAPVRSLQHEVRGDIDRAHRYANNYARQWVKKAEGDSVAQAAKVANASTSGSLTRTAVTESSQAFGSGRAKALEGLPIYEGRPDDGGGHVAHSLLKVWDATLDKLTCAICSAADGTIVGIRERFPHGEPGAVHPWCRCTWTVLTFDEQGDQGYIEPKAPANVISLPVRSPSPADAAPTVPPAVQAALHGNHQVAELLRTGFTGSVPQQGLRPESFAHLRAGGAVYGGIPTLKIQADGMVNIVDGRHRITLARERGDTSFAARILVEGPRGGVKIDQNLVVPLRPAEPGRQQLTPAKRRKK